jgi:hypothetical protein
MVIVNRRKSALMACHASLQVGQYGLPVALSGRWESDGQFAFDYDSRRQYHRPSPSFGI